MSAPIVAVGSAAAIPSSRCEAGVRGLVRSLFSLPESLSRFPVSPPSASGGETGSALSPVGFARPDILQVVHPSRCWDTAPAISDRYLFGLAASGPAFAPWSVHSVKDPPPTGDDRA